MDLDHLIIVCCHAIYIGGPLSGSSEDEWIIEPFQRAETPTFVSHAKAGLNALMEDDRGLLVFSGGPTKKARTELGEGQSYLNLCRDNQYFGYSIDVSKITVEPHATDSYQNILFSLIHFRLYVGTWPRQVTLVTHEFKRKRFMDFHLPTVGLLPLPVDSEEKLEPNNVALIGINPPEEITPLDLLVRGEMSKGIGLWKEDFYGVGEELAGKRSNRGWFQGKEEDIFLNKGLDPVVENLLRWDGGTGNELFPMIKELPWFYGNIKQ